MGFTVGLAIVILVVEKSVEKWELGGDLLVGGVVEKLMGLLSLL